MKCVSRALTFFYSQKDTYLFILSEVAANKKVILATCSESTSKSTHSPFHKIEVTFHALKIDCSIWIFHRRHFGIIDYIVMIVMVNSINSAIQNTRTAICI